MANIKTKIDTNTRPPVVVILGHVDHGKTSLLDYIRSSRVAATESAGITQHTGAYQVEHPSAGLGHGPGKIITFIDTPGHEAFSAMRSRGANVADIAVLVIAADDGVMPQTKEALHHIQHASIPFIVAINKIDKAGADVKKLKNQLLEAGIALEGYGGNIPNVEVSARTGQGVDELLDLINLVAELEELKLDANAQAELIVIESAMDAKRGPVATMIVIRGTVKVKDIIAGSTAWAKIKMLENFLGKKLTSATAATPVVVSGLNNVPQVGERFEYTANMKEAEARIARRGRKEESARIIEAGEGKKVLNIILKADVQGTLEAVHDVVLSIKTEQVILRILFEAAGDINDSDIRLAENGRAIIFGFRVKVNNVAQNLARSRRMNIRTFDTIYGLVEGMREEVANLMEAVITEQEAGKLKVLAIFKSKQNSMIVGGRIIAGSVSKGLIVRVERAGTNIGEGRALRLQSGVNALEHAKLNEEIGILFEGNIKIEVGDILHFIEQIKQKPIL